jgi:hypothetical protein
MKLFLAHFIVITLILLAVTAFIYKCVTEPIAILAGFLTLVIIGGPIIAGCWAVCHLGQFYQEQQRKKDNEQS